MSPWLISGTGTGVGKTVVTTALTVAAGRPVVAIKPIETGVGERPEDADRLARACGHPELAGVHGFVRRRAPLAPHAATLAGEPRLDFDELIEAIRAQLVPGAVHLIEGAGGLLVPLDGARTVADIARSIDAKVLLVAPDRLGVLHDVLATYEAAWSRGLDVGAVVLVQRGPPELSWDTNAEILRGRLECPVTHFPEIHDDASLAAAGAALWHVLNPS